VNRSVHLDSNATVQDIDLMAESIAGQVHGISALPYGTLIAERHFKRLATPSRPDVT